jgi:hypothetical protein
MNKLGWQLIIGGVIILLTFGGGFWAGRSSKKCPTITNDTTVVVDPYWHHIADSLAGLPPKEVIKWLPRDTLFVPGDTILAKVDTAAILKDYFSIYSYSHDMVDDTLSAVINTVVTQNKPIKYTLDYKVLTPFTTVVNTQDNSITYQKYLQFGLNVPIYSFKADSAKFDNMNKLSLELNYVFPKGYFGVGWQPQGNVLGVRFGATLIKLKKKK